ncbi:MAG: D-aminoacylase [Pseudomonadota bacterium]
MIGDCDTLIRGALILDGTGAAGFPGDLAILDGRIAAVGDCSGWEAEELLEGRGLALAPGFIDVHTHDDWAVLSDPGMACKITQGVTTVIAGNCGLSAAPFLPHADLPAPFFVAGPASRQGFGSVTAYRQALGSARPAVNLALLVGHASLRSQVMGSDLARPASPAETIAMQEALDLALRQGAIGLSSGLDYPAAAEAPAEELVALARVVAQHRGAVYTSHIRDEGDQVLEALREALQTAGRAAAPLVISHHKCAGRANYGRSVETLAMIEAARAEQVVALDAYPYVASSTSLLPQFVEDSEAVKIIWSEPHPEMAGRWLEEIAAAWDLDQREAVQRLSPAGAIYFDMDEGDLQRILAYGPTMIGSDGLPGTGRPHPRLWGAFPRVLSRYVREQRLLSLAQAVHKMTGLSARTFGLSDRGLLKAGLQADLVLFDPESVEDLATFDKPEQVARGIEAVFVRGQAALLQGGLSASRHGRFLDRRDMAEG